MGKFIIFYSDILVQFKNIIFDFTLSSARFFGKFFSSIKTNALAHEQWSEISLKNEIFGGNQAWFSTIVGKGSGCGVTSAADITAYLAKYYENYSALYKYDKDNINKDDFLRHMEEIYKFMPPTKVPFKDKVLMGIPLPDTYRRGVVRFGRSRGVNLKVKIFNKTRTKTNVINFIKEGLSKDRPVAMIQWQNKVLKPYKFHWVTIIKMEKTEEDHVLIHCLTWGRIVKLNLSDVMSARGALGKYNFLYIR